MSTNGNKERVSGQIISVVGPVVDFEFPDGQLPDIFDAVEIPLGDGGVLVCEVQQLLGNDKVRAVAMSSTDGLRRVVDWPKRPKW